MRPVIGLAAAAMLLAATSVNAQETPQVGTPPFPAGSTFAYVDIQRVAAESIHGQAANLRVQELSQQKVTEIEAKNAELRGRIDALNQQLQEAQTKLAQGQNVMSADARVSLQREITRLQLEIQRTGQDSQAEVERFTQDSEVEVQELQQQLQIEFQTKLLPAIEQVAADRQLQFIFSAGEGGLIWADRALDLTDEIIGMVNGEAAPTP